MILVECSLIQDRANEIYKKVEEQKHVRVRHQDAILAACVYIACRQEDKPRTVKGKLAASTAKKSIPRFDIFLLRFEPCKL